MEMKTNTFDINSIQLNIQTPGLKLDETLKNYLIAQIEKSGKFYSRIYRCEIMLRSIKNKEGNNCEIEIKMFLPGEILFVTDKKNNFKQASATAFEDLQFQLTKYKEKITNKSDNT